MKTIKTLAILLFSLNTFSQVQTELETSINGTYLKGGYNYEFNNKIIFGGSFGYEFLNPNIDNKFNLTTGFNIDETLYLNIDLGLVNWRKYTSKDLKNFVSYTKEEKRTKGDKKTTYFFDFGFTYLTEKNIFFDLKISTLDFLNFGLGYKF